MTDFDDSSTEQDASRPRIFEVGTRRVIEGRPEQFPGVLRVESHPHDKVIRIPMPDQFPDPLYELHRSGHADTSTETVIVYGRYRDGKGIEQGGRTVKTTGFDEPFHQFTGEVDLQAFSLTMPHLGTIAWEVNNPAYPTSANLTLTSENWGQSAAAMIMLGLPQEQIAVISDYILELDATYPESA